MKTWRKWHRWVSILIALPFLVTVTTGILLSTRGFNTWMQPKYPTNHSKELRITFDQMLEAAKSVPEANVRTWDDVSQIDIRPKSGQIRLRSKHNHWEIQVDGASGAVVHSGQRRVSWIISLHEGAAFGSLVRYGLFFPSAIGVFFLLVSGVWLFFAPYWKRAKRPKLIS